MQGRNLEAETEAEVMEEGCLLHLQAKVQLPFLYLLGPAPSRQTLACQSPLSLS